MNSVDVIRIVDDDPSITDALSFLLEGKGWNTIAYHDADTFLANDDLKVPGCLILDVRMPNSMSGLELQEQLMSIASYLPIIFISGTPVVVKHFRIKFFFSLAKQDLFPYFFWLSRYLVRG